MRARSVARGAVFALTVAAAIAALAGCRSGSPEKRFPGVTLAHSVSDASPPASMPVVVVSKTALSLEGGPQLADIGPTAGTDGFDAKYRRAPHDLFLKPLGDALASKGGVTDVGFAFDAETPYLVIGQVLLTAAQSRVATDHLLAAGAGHLVDIVLRPPRSAPAATAGVGDTVASLPMLALSVVVSDHGVMVHAGGRNVLPGCTSLGAGGFTVPADAQGAWDPALLNRCAVTLKTASPAFANETQVVVSGLGTTPWQSIVRLADLLRADPKGAPLFPDVILGVAR
jgi:hypothetical protein